MVPAPCTRRTALQPRTCRVSCRSLGARRRGLVSTSDVVSGLSAARTVARVHRQSISSPISYLLLVTALAGIPNSNILRNRNVVKGQRIPLFILTSLHVPGIDFLLSRTFLLCLPYWELRRGLRSCHDCRMRDVRVTKAKSLDDSFVKFSPSDLNGNSA